MRESKYLKQNPANIQKLMAIPTLRDFEVNSLNALLKLSKVRQYEFGESIIKEGDSDPWLYILISGKVRIVKENKELAVLRRNGDIFGEMGLLGGTPRSASAYAVTEAVCLTTDASRIGSMSLNDKMTFYCMLYRLLAEVVTDRLRTTSEELVEANNQFLRLRRSLTPQAAVA
jgi:CRP/FNR family transcriptional regulator, cyclic AMP receptor protein